jgi:ubiquinone/menaquinone biosynthesis C-methylase UbiE
MSTGNFVPALGCDFLTPFYDKVVGLTTREADFKKALVQQASVERHHWVLDLACGTGTLTIMVKEAAPEADVTGIDGDRQILEFARSTALAKHADIKFETGLLFDLPYRNESFDRVVSSLFFHHLSRGNKEKTLREVWRVLKPAGELHTADWGKPSNILSAIASFSIKLHVAFETTSENFNGLLPALIEELGFGDVKETRSFDTVFGTIRLYKSIKN